MVALVVRENDHRRILILSANGAERRNLQTGDVDLRGGVRWFHSWTDYLITEYWLLPQE